MAAPVQPLVGPLRMEKALGILAVAAALLFFYVPGAFGLPGGMNSDVGLPDDFAEHGCASCHGDNHAFAATEDNVVWAVADPEGASLTSGQYQAGETYTIQVTLIDEINPEADNHAGFYLSASAGEFHAISDTNVQITGNGLEASHTDPSTTNWTVEWTAPESGAVAFTLLVNDVDGEAGANAGDNVYRKFFALTDEDGAQLGAAEEEEVHYGVSLPQYWLGLVALASMIFVILFSFVYLKFVSPHHKDQKDR